MARKVFRRKGEKVLLSQNDRYLTVTVTYDRLKEEIIFLIATTTKCNFFALSSFFCPQLKNLRN
jgi:hypothetical protein